MPQWWRRAASIAGVLALVLPLAASGQFRGAPEDFEEGNLEYNGQFTFARIRYGRGGLWGGSSWSHDYPRADRHLPRILSELTTLRPNLDGSNVFELDDPEIFRYPLIYISEPGFWRTTPAQADALRRYVLKGGFVIFDDFENEQWRNMAAQVAKALPEYHWIEITKEHPIFHSFFEMTRIDFPHPMVAVTPRYYALFENDDPSGRMMVLANYNNDLAEYWEWSDTGMFAVDVTNEAYKLGVNYVVYAMTH